MTPGQREQAIREAERLQNLRRARGVGIGDGEDYVSSIHVRDFASLGRSHRKPVFGRLRLHTAFSDIEMDLLLNLAWDDDVVDIKEQFALDLRTTVAIAEWLGVRHPTKDRKLKIMSLDLLVTRRSTAIVEAISVKPRRLLKVRRIQQKLQVERCYARIGGWKHTIRSEEAPNALIRNLRMLNGFWELKPPPGRRPEDIARAADLVLLIVSQAPHLSLAEVCARSDAELEFGSGFSINVVWHRLATKAWSAPLDRPLDPQWPLPIRANRATGGRLD